MSPYVVALLVSVLLMAHATIAIHSMARKSVTTDEIMYFAAGYYHLRTGDFSLNATNPPLMKIVSAIPLLALKPDLPPVQSAPKTWSIIEQWRYARAFLYENHVDADRILFVARLPIVALSLLLGFYVFRWGSALYGSAAGCLALFFYAFSPNILAHARLATHDLGLAAFMFISTFYFWRFMKRPGAGSLGLCGLFAGLSLLTKTTAGFLAPIFGLYVLICAARRDGSGIYDRFPGIASLDPSRIVVRQLVSAGYAFCAIALIVLVVLNAGYGFQGTLRPSVDVRINQAGEVAVRADESTRPGLSTILRPLPTSFKRVIRSQSSIVAKSGRVYFAGKVYESGLWYLMLVSFLIKTPLAAILLLGGALCYSAWHVRTIRAEWLLLSFICVLLFVFSYMANINVGLRYVLPIYPVVHVLIGGLAGRMVERSKLGFAIVCALSLWYVGASLSNHPHYLAYINEIVGGSANGHRYLVDSNLDWGQDLKGLKRYMVERGVDRVALGYFGSADAEYYGINYEYLPSVGLAPKKAGQKWWYEDGAGEQVVDIPESDLVVVSATMLHHPSWIEGECYEFYDRLLGCKPIDQIGHSMLVFDRACIAQD